MRQLPTNTPLSRIEEETSNPQEYTQLIQPTEKEADVEPP